MFLRSTPLHHFPLSLCNLLAEEAQEFRRHFLCVGPDDAVWAAFDDVQASAFDELGRALSRRRKRNNPIIIAVNDERAKSCRKSSCQVGTHARLAVADAPEATFQLHVSRHPQGAGLS